MDFCIKTGWKAQINILWLGQAILMAMMAMSLPYWPLYISQLGDFTPLEIRYWSAAIYVAPFISSTFSSPFWGRLGDKHGYKPMVIRACLGLLLTQTLILFVSNVFLIFIIRLLQGVLAGFISAAQAWALGICPDNQRGVTIGKLQAATAIGNLLGPLTGGVIATYLGYHAIFTSSSLICLLVTVMFYFFLQNTAPSTEDASEPSLKDLTLFSRLQKPILSLLSVIIIMQLARAVITPIFALFVTERLGGNDMTIGVLYAATGLMIFISAPLWGKFFDHYIAKGHQAPVIIAGLLFISAVLQVMHAYSESATAIFILRLLWGICLGALLPVLTRLLVDNAKKNERGLILGFGNSATKMGNLFGILLGALIEAYLGYTNSFLMNALLYIAAGVIILVRIKPLQTLTQRRYSVEGQ
jgi:MFS transporter, DHA1 family, staphyloferrin B biosynthesis exporter